MSIRGLSKDWRRRLRRPRHLWLYGLWTPTCSRSTTDWTQRGDTSKTENDSSSFWKRLRASPEHVHDDDDDDVCYHMAAATWQVSSAVNIARRRSSVTLLVQNTCRDPRVSADCDCPPVSLSWPLTECSVLACRGQLLHCYSVWLASWQAHAPYSTN